MRGRFGRWKATAFLLVAAETGILFWAYYALGLGGQLRSLESDPRILAGISEVYQILHGFVPAWVSRAFADFTGALGLASPLRQVVDVGAALGTSGSLSSLGSAIVAPAYFAARRLMRRRARPSDRAIQRAVHWRIRLPRARVVGPMAPGPTAALPSV